MATQELADVTEFETWQPDAPRSAAMRALIGLATFGRKKPLGAVCGLIVLFFIIVGDLVPETVNQAASLAGMGKPVPYVADAIEARFDVVYPYYKQDLRAKLEGPSARHLLGTDELGRDTLSRLLYGARIAVMVSFGAQLISELISASFGIMSGYYGGVFDKFLYRIADVFQALPGLVMLISVLGLIGSGLWPMIIAIGLLGWATGSRVIRGQTISIMTSPFIEAARVVGAGDRRIMVHYVLPNVLPLIILGSTVRLGSIVLIEATLSFLGYGMPPPFPSWGQMLGAEGREYLSSQPGLAIFPGLAIGLLVFSYNLFGDALRDVMDPRLRGRR